MGVPTKAVRLSLLGKALSQGCAGVGKETRERGEVFDEKATYHLDMLGAQVPRVIVSRLTRPSVVHKHKQGSRDTMEG